MKKIRLKKIKNLYHASVIVILSLFYGIPLPSFREDSGNPLQYSCLENLMGRRAW